jgi:hypothetical protein
VEEEETGRSDGSAPLAVAVGDVLRAVVGFAGLPAPGTTSATLHLDGTGWEHIEVPVFLLIGKPVFVPVVEPTAIYRAAEPGETLTQDVVITPTKTGVKVVAFIDGGREVIRLVRMIAFRPVKKEFTAEERNELSPLQQGVPGYPLPTEYVEYQEAARSDGRTPLAVTAGYLVRLYVEFVAPLVGFPDVTVTNLTIDAANWQRVQIPLKLIIGKITASISVDALTVRQGETAALDVSLISVAGPATDVEFELGFNPDKRWVVEPPAVHLPKGGTVDRSLKVRANLNAPVGTFDVGFEAHYFDRLKLLRLPLRLTVRPAVVTAKLLQTAVVATQGDKVTCQVEVTSQGGHKVIELIGSSPPPGVHMTPMSYYLGPNPATVVIPVEFVVDALAPAATAVLVGIIWNAGDGEHSGALFLRFTVNLKPDSRTFHQVITTPPGTALGGWAEITIRTDGSYTFRGHMEGSGFDPYAFRIGVVVRGASGTISLATIKNGNVGGWILGGSQDYDWEENKTSALITSNWADLRNGTAEFNKWYKNTGVLGTLQDIAVAVVEFLAVNAVAGPQVAAVIVLGSELGALTGLPFEHPPLLAGAAVAGGVILLFGPSLMLPAVIAGLAAGAQLHSRPLRESEKQFAAQVFGDDTLPVDQIRVTNLSRGNRKFCVPHGDGTILVCMGEMEEDTLQTNRRAVFVHELTHAWQIKHYAFSAELIWEAAINEVKGTTAAYTYALDGRAWSDYGAEQQARIIQDWYSIYANDLGSQAALRDPRFPYIQNNIRLGQT